MSYEIKDAEFDLQSEITTALKNKDEFVIRKLAHIVKATGDDEGAEELLETANRLARERYKEDWAYDEAKDNEL